MAWIGPPATPAPPPPCTAPTSGRPSSCCRVRCNCCHAPHATLPLPLMLNALQHSAAIPQSCPLHKLTCVIPAERPGWREEAEAALAHLLGVARLLMRALALALEQPEEFFTSKCQDPVAQMVFFRCEQWGRECCCCAEPDAPAAPISGREHAGRPSGRGRCAALPSLGCGPSHPSATRTPIGSCSAFGELSP